MAVDPATPPSDAGFEVVRKGYDQGQVDAHLRRLDAELSILVTDRDAALAQAVQLAKELDEARVRAEKLRAQVRTLASPQQSPLNTSERIRSMLRLAEDEVADMLARAETEANRRRQEADTEAAQAVTTARAEADGIREEARTEAEQVRHELAQEREAFEQERTSSLERLAGDRAAADADIKARTEAAEDERTRVWAKSEARRKLIEEDFTLAMEQRREESLAALGAERDATHRELENLRESTTAHARAEIARAEEQARSEIARAEEQARTMIHEAERRVDELVAARTRIAEQLGRTRAMLENTLGSVALRPEELTTAQAIALAVDTDVAVSGGDGAMTSPRGDGARTSVVVPGDGHPTANGAASDGVGTDSPAADARACDAPVTDTESADADAADADAADTDDEQPTDGTVPVPRPRRRQRRRTQAGSTHR